MSFYIRGPNFAALKTGSFKLAPHVQKLTGLQLRVNLWGDYAYKMQEYIHNNSDNRHIVVILQFGQINVWRDRPSVNTYFTSSKLFINSDIDEIIDFNKMFMIPIRVRDNTGTLTLTMFEREGKYLLKQSAKELVKKMERLGDNLDFYPGGVNALKGLKLAFKISVTKFNVSKKNNQYGIARISDDESLIEQLENKLTESQPSNSQSLDFGSADLQSQEIKNLMDAIFGTDDNITPSTVDKNETTSLMKSLSTTPVLKRNLKEVFIYGFYL
ncbi:unnamed protein product [Lactuca virosa]|uniref:Uncharacterized protein n=1 Tax=Lactuca virosa TaxID=75947 RepID=A0AAU9NPQ0_9ASTR|nr:unnamed protein product [Lactuca virosa]